MGKAPYPRIQRQGLVEMSQTTPTGHDPACQVVLTFCTGEKEDLQRDYWTEFDRDVGNGPGDNEINSLYSITSLYWPLPLASLLLAFRHIANTCRGTEQCKSSGDAFYTVRQHRGLNTPYSVKWNMSLNRPMKKISIMQVVLYVITTLLQYNDIGPFLYQDLRRQQDSSIHLCLERASSFRSRISPSRPQLFSSRCPMVFLFSSLLAKRCPSQCSIIWMSGFIYRQDMS